MTAVSAPKGLKPEITSDYAVLRVDKQLGRWEAIPVALINDSALGWDTRAFAVWLLTKPDGWEIKARALPGLLTVRSGHIGRDKTRRFLRELQARGYLRRTLAHSRDGRWVWRYAFHAVPRDPTVDGFAGDGQAVDGSPVDGKGVDKPHTVRNSTRSDVRTKPATTERPEACPNSSGAGDESEVRYPKCLQGDVHASAARLLTSCPVKHRQAVLDEIRAIAVRRVVRSPIGLLHCLIEKAKAGTFVANLSITESRVAAQEARAGSPASQPRSAQPPNALVPVSDIAERVLQDLKARLKPSTE